MNTSKFVVESINNDTLEGVIVAECDTETAAIKLAEKASAASEFDGPAASIVVYDQTGDVVWDNEGDWRNAVR